MNEDNMKLVLEIFKNDLGVSSNARDVYYTQIITSSFSELSEKCEMDLKRVEDQMLLSDYAMWIYQKRREDVPISNNLRHRILNRKMKRRSS